MAEHSTRGHGCTRQASRRHIAPTDRSAGAAWQIDAQTAIRHSANTERPDNPGNSRSINVRDNNTTAPDPNKVDAMRLSLMLTELRPPTISQLWQRFAQRADKEGWTAARFLAALAEHELAERDRRRIERHLREAKLLPGKSLESFDFNVVPMISRAQVNALATGDAWLGQGANCLVFGPPDPDS